jgi:hypothetical protein
MQLPVDSTTHKYLLSITDKKTRCSAEWRMVVSVTTTKPLSLKELVINIDGGSAICSNLTKFIGVV